MRKFLKALIVIPLGVIFIVFAVANRHWVTVSFDPFSSSDPSLKVTSPLFVVIIVVALIGVAAGGSATRFRQRRWRRAARQYEADARQMRAQLAEVQAATVAQRGSSVPAFPALSKPGGYGTSGRDKQGATL